MVSSRQSAASRGSVVELLVQEREDPVDSLLLPVLGEGGVALALQLDSDEVVAEQAPQYLEAGAGGTVRPVAETEHLAPGGSPGDDRLGVGGGEVQVGATLLAHREGHGRLRD